MSATSAETMTRYSAGTGDSPPHGGTCGVRLRVYGALAMSDKGQPDPGSGLGSLLERVGVRACGVCAAPAPTVPARGLAATSGRLLLGASAGRFPHRFRRLAAERAPG